MKNLKLMVVFLVIVLVQLSVPASMIMRREIVLRSGKQFRFKTAPVDPYDAFRGRYVWLRIQPDEASYEGETLYRGNKIFVSLYEDKDGYAQVASVSKNKPDEGDYIQTKASYRQSKSRVGIDWQFTRYYMEESIAPEAERVARNQSSDAVVTVRVKDGFAVLEELYVNDVPIGEYVKNQLNTTK